MFEDAKVGGEMTDMEFELDSGAKIRGHKLWLTVRCEYIRGELADGASQVRVKGCGEGAFMALLEFIYTGRLGNSCMGQEWGQLSRLAELFGMKGMSEMLMNAQAPSMDNLEAAARFAAERGMRPMMERCIEALPSKPEGVEQARLVMRVMDILLVQCGNADGLKLLEKAVDIVVGAMRGGGKEDASVQERGCVALGRVSGLGVENRRMTAKKGGIEATVAAMNWHRASPHVQIEACAALCNMTLEDAENVRRAGEAGATEAVIGGLKAHPANNRVQERGCSAMRNLCINDANSRRAGVGGMAVVLKAVKNLRLSSARVQEVALAALCNLVYVDKIRCSVVASGGIEAVVQTLNRS